MITLYGATVIISLSAQVLLVLGGVRPFIRILKKEHAPLDFVKIPMCLIVALTLIERHDHYLAHIQEEASVTLIMINIVRVATFGFLLHALYLEKRQFE